MTGMHELSQHIIALAKSNGTAVTNLQIQKVMFFTLGMHIRKVGKLEEKIKEIYDIPFDKWRYGPVVETIYYRLNHFKDKDITLSMDGRYYNDFSEWDNLILKLLDIDVFNLVKLSHDLPSWSDYEEDILARNFVESYKIEEIAEDFIK